LPLTGSYTPDNRHKKAPMVGRGLGQLGVVISIEITTINGPKRAMGLKKAVIERSRNRRDLASVLIDAFVYAEHGHELMRRKSSVGRSPS